MSNPVAWWQKFNYAHPAGLKPASVRVVTRAASWGYGLVSAAWHAGYDLGLRRVIKTPLPVIGVGNLAAGGTGKTPLVIKVVETLLSMGLKSAVISRGHGRRGVHDYLWVSKGRGPEVRVEESGDEPYLLAQRLPVPVIVGKDRVRLVEEILRVCGPVVVVGDDLFQHRRLYRDLDIVALDAGQPLGNGHMLPLGPLREPAGGLRRAQVLILTRADNQAQLARARVWLRGFWGEGPILDCRHQINALGGRQGDLITDWKDKKVMAFCALANPRAFRNSLQSLGLTVVHLMSFPDHHWFDRQDWRNIQAEALRLGVSAIVTSEKDATRLPEHFTGDIDLWISRLELVFPHDHLARVLAWGLSGYNYSKKTL
ncbi:MAG: tetraacyldisaccharide 4'-kinase [Desulfarculales bacterium]|jgi:tetraacyldisaccharide 4'-kinase|nr:tetraacyldisaccharide 4'-kinase [Desulfarculales bacterium]